ncbi:hypothetical protein Dimus_030095 [Dionaea muscipula]
MASYARPLARRWGARRRPHPRSAAAAMPPCLALKITGTSKEEAFSAMVDAPREAELSMSGSTLDDGRSSACSPCLALSCLGSPVADVRSWEGEGSSASQPCAQPVSFLHELGWGGWSLASKGSRPPWVLGLMA